MKYGFIGTGNMGGALARAVAKQKGGSALLLANRTAAKAEKLAADIGAAVGTNIEVAEKCKYIFLGVKPQMMADMLSGIKDVLGARKSEVVLVSMAAGLSCEKISDMAGGGFAVIRLMPNTPVSIGEGIVLYCSNTLAAKADEDELVGAISAAGMADAIDEKLIDAASAVSGCGPAFAYMFIEALADGAVECGLPRAKAMGYAAQMLLGSAALVLRSGEHPGKLKDDVCSPGGSTINGVHALESGAFRAAAADAVVKAYEKTVALGKN